MPGAAVAQPVEQRIRNAWVGGSNPLRGTINNTYTIDIKHIFTNKLISTLSAALRCGAACRA